MTLSFKFSHAFRVVYSSSSRIFGYFAAKLEDVRFTLLQEMADLQFKKKKCNTVSCTQPCITVVILLLSRTTNHSVHSEMNLTIQPISSTYPRTKDLCFSFHSCGPGSQAFPATRQMVYISGFAGHTVYHNYSILPLQQ